MRCELHPATDRWMMGDRFGEVVRTSRKADGTIAHTVRLDVSGKTIKVTDGNLYSINGVLL